MGQYTPPKTPDGAFDVREHIRRVEEAAIGRLRRKRSTPPPPLPPKPPKDTGEY